MKHLLVLFLLTFIILSVSGNEHRARHSQDEVVATNDSTIDIIGWFSKNDTLVYWINTAEWKVKRNDTTRTSSTSMKVMINVTDSTKDGYCMNYTILDIVADSSSDAGMLKFVEALKQGVVGTVIKFRTTEFGEIIKYDNLEEIKKQAKELYTKAVNIIFKPETFQEDDKQLAQIYKAMFKNIDTDDLVKGYIEELELLFRLHGSTVVRGERQSHDDETEKEYASDTYSSAEEDTATGDIHVSLNVDNYIPAADVSKITGAVVKGFLDKKTTKKVKKMMDDNLDEPMVMSDNYTATYFSVGWPKTVVSQQKNMFEKLGSGKLKQTLIEWESASIGNY